MTASSPSSPWPLVWTKDTADSCAQALHAMHAALGRLASQQLVGFIEEALAVDSRFTHVSVAFDRADNEVKVGLHMTLDDGSTEEVSLGHEAYGSELTDEQTGLLENIYVDIDGLVGHEKWGAITRDHLASTLARPCDFARNELATLHRKIAGPEAYDAWKATQEAIGLDVGLPSGDAGARRAGPRM